MSRIYKSNAELVGNTPLVEVTNIEKELGLEAKVLVKLEYFNPAGSVKDRIGLAMIEEAEKTGKLKQGQLLLSQHQEIQELDLLLSVLQRDIR